MADDETVAEEPKIFVDKRVSSTKALDMIMKDIRYDIEQAGYYVLGVKLVASPYPDEIAGCVYEVTISSYKKSSEPN
jgi:hypothetical protein